MTCIQVTQRKPKGFENWPNAGDGFFNSLQLTKHQARMLATELLLFAEGREIDWDVE
jgi:hypothetical protein